MKKALLSVIALILACVFMLASCTEAPNFSVEDSNDTENIIHTENDTKGSSYEDEEINADSFASEDAATESESDDATESEDGSEADIESDTETDEDTNADTDADTDTEIVGSGESEGLESDTDGQNNMESAGVETEEITPDESGVDTEATDADGTGNNVGGFGDGSENTTESGSGDSIEDGENDNGDGNGNGDNDADGDGNNNGEGNGDNDADGDGNNNGEGNGDNAVEDDENNDGEGNGDNAVEDDENNDGEGNGDGAVEDGGNDNPESDGADNTENGDVDEPDNDEDSVGEEDIVPEAPVQKDNVPSPNQYKGVMHYMTTSGAAKSCDVEFIRDYKYLIDGDNEAYSKELSKMSALFASDVYNNVYLTFSAGATGGNDSPTNFGSGLGLRNLISYDIKGSDYAYDKDDVTQFVVGHRSFIYNGKPCEVIIVSVRGTNETNAEWSSNFDVGADSKNYYDMVGYDHPDWKNKLNHKGFDVAANRVYDKLSEYIGEYVDKNSQVSVLVTGHSRGAAIANILGQMFTDNTDYKTFAYTFAAPNNTTATNTASYKNIFNIVNSDDIITYLPLAEWGFTKYGVIKTVSVKEYYGSGKKEGSFKWFVGEGYNDDGGMQRTIDCFAALATCREDLYRLDSSDDGKFYYRGNLASGYSEKDATAKFNELTTAFAEQKLSKFCTVKILDYGGIWKYQVEVNYCPAFFMQMLSNMTTGVGPLLGHDISGKYNDAKLSFIASSGKVVIGGMEHPHMQPTYYLIARNDFLTIDELNG